ncbi:MAG: hypothetical protein SGPRY_010289 [Prymnesium sp.]
MSSRRASPIRALRVVCVVGASVVVYAVREPAPRTKQALADLAKRSSSANLTLFNYFFPAHPTVDVYQNYVEKTKHCIASTNCYCGHVQGGMDKTSNPPSGLVGKEACEHAQPFNKKTFANRTISRVACTWGFLNRTCSRHVCITGRGKPCLYSHMEPSTMVAIIALARAAGIRHIIEEGREGGLSAFLYRLHGFRVTSVEYLPEDGPLAALKEMAPDIALIHGDGAQLIPSLVEAMNPREAARTMVIYDGEKRIPAHMSYKKIRHKVAMAAFDDSNFPTFHTYMDDQAEIWWESLHGTHIGIVDGVVSSRQVHMRRAGMNAKGQMGNTGTLFVVGGGWKQTSKALATTVNI